MSCQSLKHVRIATGLSQKAFAELVDFSLDTIASIEQGRLDVGEKLARAVFIGTGALPAFLVAKSCDIPEAWTREQYTPEHFRVWKLMSDGDLISKISGGTRADRFVKVLECALSAAAEKKVLGRFQTALNLALFDIIFSEGIEHEARAIASKTGSVEDFNLLARLAGRIQKP